jgi:aminoglycoside phosphotransferase (APT) family kinase protein
MIGTIQSFLDEQWAELRPGAPPPAAGIVIGSDRDPAANITMLFLDGSGRPAAVAKVARQVQGERGLAAEHAVLQQLATQGSSWLRSQVPEALGLQRIGGRLVLVTSPIPGQPLRTMYFAPGHVTDRRRVEEDFAAGEDWLATFHNETRLIVATFGEDAHEQWVDAVIERYRREIGWSDEEDDLFRQVRQRAQDLQGSSIPIVASHGDFVIGNIMVEHGRVRGLIDWERGELARPPFRDIYKFCTSYGMYLHLAAPGPRGGVPGHAGRKPFETWRRYGSWQNLPGIGYTYFGAGWFPELVRGFVLRHLDRLGIAYEANAVFFPIFLAEEAMSLPDPAFRSGYRSALRAVAANTASTWLWANEVAVG